jgi:peptidoglycan/LPS O-acetylase OafA/YrhL
LPTLDGWRAVAIAGVLFCHASESLVASGAYLPGSTAYQLAALGAKGVDLFFALSGFLITSRLLEEENSHGGIPIKAFYIRRFFRIVPPYLLFLGSLVLFRVTGLIPLSLGEGLSCLAFFRNCVPESWCGWYTGHFWSLSIEEHFYLIWPGLLILAGPGRRRCLVAALGAGLIALWRSLEFRWQLLAAAAPDVGFFTRTDIRLDALLWGCWAALLWDDPVWRGFLGRVLGWPWFLLVILYGVVLVGRMPLSFSTQALVMPFLIVGTLARTGGMAAFLLELPVVKWVGRLSYSLYLWQQLFLVPTQEMTGSWLTHLQTWPFNLMATFVCACISYYWIERPMIRLGQRLARRSDQPPGGAVGSVAHRFQCPVAV